MSASELRAQERHGLERGARRHGRRAGTHLAGESAVTGVPATCRESDPLPVDCGLTLTFRADTVDRIGLTGIRCHLRTDVGASLPVADNRLFGPDTMNAPWGLDSRLRLVALACDFFNANGVAANHAVIGKELPNSGVPTPLTVLDFLKYLEVKKAFPRTPNAFRVARIVERMVSTGLLLRTGPGSPSIAGLQDHYVYMPMIEGSRRDLFQLVPVLGAEYLYRLCAPSLVHIAGTNAGVPVAGTGLVVQASHILTCRHVVSDMALDQSQVFQGREYVINADSIQRHPDLDVAVMRVDGPPLSPMQGILFQTPVVAQTVYTLGYPKLPGLRDASVTMQRGAVTNESVTSLAGDRLFLYSAIARPGNSGGPSCPRTATSLASRSWMPSVSTFTRMRSLHTTRVSPLKHSSKRWKTST